MKQQRGYVLLYLLLGMSATFLVLVMGVAHSSVTLHMQIRGYENNEKMQYWADGCTEIGLLALYESNGSLASGSRDFNEWTCQYVTENVNNEIQLQAMVTVDNHVTERTVTVIQENRLQITSWQ